MLGKKVGSTTATCVNKALPSNGGGMPRMETAATGAGELVGAEVKIFATYHAEMRPDGTFYGECPNSGVVMAADGVATFRASGIGKPTSDGGFSFRGSVYFEASAPSLAELNGIACMYQWDVNANDEATWEIWACD